MSLVAGERLIRHAREVVVAWQERRADLCWLPFLIVAVVAAPGSVLDRGGSTCPASWLAGRPAS